MKENEKVSVLMVCMGNICRSPTAEGVFVKLVKEHQLETEIRVDSAGTHAYHVGDAPDPRAQRIALKRGVNLGKLKARRVKLVDFEKFDYILAMDRENLVHLETMCPDQYMHKLNLFLFYAESKLESEVPDPYYGNSNGFERVLDMIEGASLGLLNKIKAQHLNSD